MTQIQTAVTSTSGTAVAGSPPWTSATGKRRELVQARSLQKGGALLHALHVYVISNRKRGVNCRPKFTKRLQIDRLIGIYGQVPIVSRWFESGFSGLEL